MYIDGQKVVQSIYYLSLKISEESCDITLKGFAKFKGKPTRGLKNDTRNLVNFYASSLMTLKSDAKFEGKLILGSKKWHEEFGEF